MVGDNLSFLAPGERIGPAMTDTQNTLAPAGWYSDPQGLPQQRWWNGTNWTHSVAPPVSRLSQMPGPRVPQQQAAPERSALPASADPSTPFPTRRQLRESGSVFESGTIFAMQVPREEVARSYAPPVASPAAQADAFAMPARVAEPVATQAPAQAQAPAPAVAAVPVAVTAGAATPVAAAPVAAAPVAAAPAVAAPAVAPVAPILAAARAAAPVFAPAAASPAAASPAASAPAASAPAATATIAPPAPQPSYRAPSFGIPSFDSITAGTAAAVPSPVTPVQFALPAYLPTQPDRASSPIRERPASSARSTITDDIDDDVPYQPFGLIPVVRSGTMATPERVNTTSAWLLAFAPLVMAAALYGFATGLPEFYTQFAQWALFFIFAVVTVWLAVADRRELSSAGYLRPASPAWTLLTPLAYYIARSTRTSAQARKLGLAPLVTWVVAVAAVAAIAFLVPELAEKALTVSAHIGL